MAQKESRNLIISGLLLFCLAAAGQAAVSKEEAKKFPPISGDIYGQVLAGVHSMTINNKPVYVNPDQTFRSFVKLKAGEKYLILKINYEGLRIIKKYLIIRKPQIKSFRVFVPKEEIKIPPEVKKEMLARKKRERARYLKMIKEMKEMERKAFEEKRWVKKVASPKFFSKEFRGPASVEALGRAIDLDNYGAVLKSKPGTLERLNELLRVPNFYDLAVRKGKAIKLSEQLKRLIAETKSFRGMRFSDLTDYQRKKIMLLNRLLLKAFYAEAPSRASWLVPEEIVLPTKKTRVCEYLYVWEFDKGKLLLVKEWKGKYSAEIHIPSAREWMALDEITREELQKIIEKPVSSFKQKKGKK